jgi:hypothetical protein
VRGREGGREGGWNNRNYWTDAGVGEREMEKWVGRVGWGGGGLNGSARFMTLFLRLTCLSVNVHLSLLCPFIFSLSGRTFWGKKLLVRRLSLGCEVFFFGVSGLKRAKVEK